MAYHILLLAMNRYDFPLDWVFEHLVQRRSDGPSIVDPGSSQQARVGGTDVHHIKCGVESLRSHFNWDVHLPVDHPFRTVKGSENDIAGL